MGTGSTVAHALDRIGELLRYGVLRDVIGISTSEWVAGRAAAIEIPLVDLNTHPVVDLSIDSADEVDPALNLVKGLGWVSPPREDGGGSQPPLRCHRRQVQDRLPPWGQRPHRPRGGLPLRLGPHSPPPPSASMACRA
ncbi:putative ribose-5-phosphate isomerase 1 [Canna indica]|uniref:ribose-5-phosphate isomerase n=1 Tax=Canna indica TaxID=4628 RepID=A0AAQ3QQR0_9LILI|nr:putative ribose-5-phosphate isomerase 1 [Canna indica]